MGVMVMLGGGMGFDPLETEQLPETIGHSCGVTPGVTRTAASIGGRDDLDVIQHILAANGRSGWVAEDDAGRADWITGRD